MSEPINHKHYHHHHHKYDWGHPVPSKGQSDDDPPKKSWGWVVATILGVVLILVVIGLYSKSDKQQVARQEPTTAQKGEDKATPVPNTKSDQKGGVRTGEMNDKNNQINVGNNNKNTKIHVGDKKVSQTQHIRIVQHVHPVKVVKVPMTDDVGNNKDCEELRRQHEVVVAQWSAHFKR